MHHRHARHRDSRRRKSEVSERDLLVGACREASDYYRALCSLVCDSFIGVEAAAEVKILKPNVFVWRNGHECGRAIGALLLVGGDDCVG